MITTFWTIGCVLFGLSCLCALIADGCDLWRTTRIYERWAAILITIAFLFFSVAMYTTSQEKTNEPSNSIHNTKENCPVL